MEIRLKTLSHGLPEAVPSHKGLVVQFIHHSVKDFFIKKYLSTWGDNTKSTETEPGLDGLAHYRLSRACVHYLAMEEICDIPKTVPISDSEFPFSNYAISFWVPHAKQSDEANVPQSELLEDFRWPSETCLESWIRNYFRLLPEGERPLKGAHMTHVVSYYGLVGLLQSILQKADRGYINSRNDLGGTPLCWATRRGHKAVVKLLLDTGKAAVDSKEIYGWTPLSQAASKGQEAIVKLLLYTGKVEVDSKSHNGQIPLLLAASGGTRLLSGCYSTRARSRSIRKISWLDTIIAGGLKRARSYC